jgi:hypothetical protein
MLTGKIHRHSHPNFLMSGEVIVVTENGGKEHLKAPLSMISEPGTKRAVVALEDTVWITVHVTNETDLDKIEDYVIAKSYDDPILIENQLKKKNCLILALKEKGRDFGSLLGLKSDGALLPFKESLEKIKENNIPIDGLFAIKGQNNEWHVTTENGIPLSDVMPNQGDMVGSWVAVGVTGAAGVGSYFGSKGNKSSAQQVPLETAEQNRARRLLLEYAQSGQFGNITAGEDLGLPMGNYTPTDLEQAGLGRLRTMLGETNNQDLDMARSALGDLLSTSEANINKQFDPFQQTTARSIRESQDALKRASAFGERCRLVADRLFLNEDTSTASPANTWRPSPK